MSLLCPETFRGSQLGRIKSSCPNMVHMARGSPSSPIPHLAVSKRSLQPQKTTGKFAFTSYQYTLREGLSVKFTEKEVRLQEATTCLVQGHPISVPEQSSTLAASPASALPRATPACPAGGHRVSFIKGVAAEVGRWERCQG